MTDQTDSGPAPPRDRWVGLGIAVSAVAAAVSSFSGLYELALAAGWQAALAPLLPLTVDVFAATATRVWLASNGTPATARRFARRCAIGAIMLSLLGNAAWHLIAADLVAVTWLVVLVVGAVPPVVLGLVSHLTVLRAQPSRFDAGTATPAPVRPAGNAPYDHSDHLLTAGRDLAREYGRTHNGRRITRDELRRALRISAARASELLRELKQEAGYEADQEPLSIPQR